MNYGRVFSIASTLLLGSGCLESTYIEVPAGARLVGDTVNDVDDTDGPSGAVKQETRRGNLVSFHMAKGTPVDSSGRGWHGRVSDPRDAVGGRYGAGIRLEPGESITLTDRPEYFSPGSSTFEGWILRRGTAETILFGDLDTTTTPHAEFAVTLLQADDGVRIASNEGCDTTLTSVRSTLAVVPVGSWTHLGVVVEDAEVRLFINGELMDTVTLPDTACEKAEANFRIGGASSNAPFTLDELKWSNYPKTTAEIRSSLLFDSTRLADNNLKGCGDGTTDTGEACDDGNSTACDGCSPACTIETSNDWYTDNDGDGYGVDLPLVSAICGPWGLPSSANNNSDCDDDNADFTLTCGPDPAVIGDILYFSFEPDTIDGVSVADGSTTGKSGTIVEAQAVPGKYGQGMFFSGSKQRVEVVESSAMFAPSYTFEAWVLRDKARFSLAGHGQQSIFGDYEWYAKQDPPINAEFEVLLMPLGEGVRVVTNTGCVLGDNENLYSTTTDVPLSVWTHLAITWDGSFMTFYLNGVPTETQALAGASCERAAKVDWAMGARAQDGRRPFTGTLDEVKFSRGAKTAEQIKLSMEYMPPGSVDHPDPCDEQAGPTILATYCTECHSTVDPRGQLDLETAGVFNRLKDKVATACAPSKIIDPLQIQDSLLYSLLSAADGGCAQMPKGNPALSSGEKACLLQWLAREAGL